jgi:hypothetical protein
MVAAGLRCHQPTRKVDIVQTTPQVALVALGRVAPVLTAVG